MRELSCEKSEERCVRCEVFSGFSGLVSGGVRSERRHVGDGKWEVRGCERRDARGERHGGGSEECSVLCVLFLGAAC